MLFDQISNQFRHPMQQVMPPPQWAPSPFPDAPVAAAAPAKPASPMAGVPGQAAAPAGDSGVSASAAGQSAAAGGSADIMKLIMQIFGGA